MKENVTFTDVFSLVQHKSRYLAECLSCSLHTMNGDQSCKGTFSEKNNLKLSFGFERLKA